MFENFFKTTLRTLLRNKTYSFLNILGLAIGIACTGLIFLWVEDEVGFDSVNVKRDRLYMVMNNWPVNGKINTFESTPGPMAAALKTEVPGIANSCRVTEGSNNLLFTIGDKTMYASGDYADSNMFSMFTMPFVQGNAAKAFRDLNSIVITEKTAKKFFGNEKNVIGKTVMVDNKKQLAVTGVIKDFPQNSSLQFEWVAPMGIYLAENDWMYYWDYNSTLTFVELDGKASLPAVSKQLHGLIKKHEADAMPTSILFNMNDWHLRFAFENGKPTGGGQIEYVRMFTVIAWIVLLLACINFMNLSTARSERRAREVGVRKVLGSSRKSLVMQFMGEALLMASLSALVAVVIMTTALPAFNELANKDLSLNLTSPLHIGALAAITVVCGLVAGSYPSLLLSSFRPVNVLKGLKLKAGSAGLIRRGLVVMQFTVSIVLIISTVIVFQQIQHVKKRDLGYSKDNLMGIPLQGDMGKNFAGIKQHLLNTGVVENATLSNHHTISGGNNSVGFKWKGKDPNAKILISVRDISPELLATNGIKIIAGRNFNADPATDSLSVIITQSLARLMNVKTAIGETLQRNGKTYKIVGVINDLVYGNIYTQSDPLVYFCASNYQDENLLYVKLKPGVDQATAIAKIEAVIKTDNPGYPFDYSFEDDLFNNMFISEAMVSKLSRVFAALAIIISCLGLFGLAAYTAERRTKEIGIRKVLGATASRLVGMLCAEFVKLVLLSALLAFPIAWYAMHKWLLNYAYHVNINWWVFAAAGAGALLIAIATISFQAVKAAMMTPVKAIKTE